MRIDGQADETALRLVEAHGARAQQVVIDGIVVAIRLGDEAAAAAGGDVLRAIERMAPNSLATAPIGRAMGS